MLIPSCGEARRALEARERAEVALEPACLLGVDDEPALACRLDAFVGALVLRLGNHGATLADS